MSVDVTLSGTQRAFFGMPSVSTKEMSVATFGYCKQTCGWINGSTSCLGGRSNFLCHLKAVDQGYILRHQ